MSLIRGHCIIIIVIIIETLFIQIVPKVESLGKTQQEMNSKRNKKKRND